MLYFPAFAIGIMLSPNHPQMNRPAYFVALVVETTLIVLGAWSVIVFASRTMRPRR